MCAAVPVAALMLLVFAGLSLLRLFAPHAASPNADLVAALLNSIDSPLSHPEARPKTSQRPD